jgi:hypothetical protein
VVTSYPSLTPWATKYKNVNRQRACAAAVRTSLPSGLTLTLLALPTDSWQASSKTPNSATGSSKCPKWGQTKTGTMTFALLSNACQATTRSRSELCLPMTLEQMCCGRRTQVAQSMCQTSNFSSSKVRHVEEGLVAACMFRTFSPCRCTCECRLHHLSSALSQLCTDNKSFRAMHDKPRELISHGLQTQYRSGPKY